MRRRACVVFDLDETVLRRSALGQALVYVPLTSLVPGVGLSILGEPCKDAVRTCQHLAELGVDQVGVTARWGGMGHFNTRRWLDSRGFGHFGLHCAPHPLRDEAARLRWKSECIRGLQQQGCDIVAGVGDRESDIRAYLSSGIPLVIGVAHEDPRGLSVSERSASLRACGERFRSATQRVVVVSEGCDERGVTDGGVEGESVWSCIDRLVCERVA